MTVQIKHVSEEYTDDEVLDIAAEVVCNEEQSYHVAGSRYLIERMCALIVNQSLKIKVLTEDLPTNDL